MNQLSLPNFFVVGAQKAGTTSLYHYLSSHPDIYLPSQKETRFFVMDELYSKGIDFYKNEFFSSVSDKKAVGEMDPNYMFFERALDRIGDNLDLAQVKFIFLLRNPVDRAFSHYLMICRRGMESLSCEDAIAQESSRIANGGYYEKVHYSYIRRGFYFSQIERFLSRVDRSQMLFLLTEDLKYKPESCLKEIFSFLDISSNYMPTNISNTYHCAKVPINASLQRRIVGGDSVEKKLLRMLIPYKPLREKLRTKLLACNQRSGKNIKLSNETRRMLIDTYTSEVHKLEQFLGRNLDSWIVE